MNKTQSWGVEAIESVFDFLKVPAKSWKISKAYAKPSLQKHLTTLLSIIVLVTAINWPPVGNEVPESPTVSNFESAIILDRNNYSLLTIESPSLKIRPGKSLAQEQADAAARARRLVASPPTRVSGTIATVAAHAMVQDAATKAGIDQYWKVLAAVWQKETGKSGDSCIVSRADGRAIGPMQFMPGTFRAHAQSPDADICKVKDSLEAAADLLKNAGLARGDVTHALLAYNHSLAYANSVQQIANSIE